MASRVPPTPIDTDRIPGIEIGPALEGDATPAVRRDGRAGSSARHAARGSDARGRGDSPRGRAVPAAYGKSGGAAGQNVAGGPRSGDGNSDDQGAAPPGAPTPAPTPAPAAAASGGAGEPADAEPAGPEPADEDEDAAPAPAATASRNDADEVEVETEPGPGRGYPRTHTGRL